VLQWRSIDQEACLTSDEQLFRDPVTVDGRVALAPVRNESANQAQSSRAFTEKWNSYDESRADEDEPWKQAQFDWYLRCYGFESEADFASFLADKRTILDAGCGPGYKAAWMARLAPHATVVAMDLSESIHLAARRYAARPNMRFVRGDIAFTPFRDGAFDFISCDQVLHHTNDPPATVREFARIITPGGAFNSYVYAKKALPRELLDEHFREYSKALSSDEIWALSDQLTQLGRTLSELKIEIDVPDMPALGIRGQRTDLQRFIYWNFIKCFWNEDFGYDESRGVNFDWYAPSTAFRYSAEEFGAMMAAAGFEPQFLHSEEACHTGRFRKPGRSA
jgi:ubiquinone/menaquinone biosynthesis C-methylase UbiE